MQVNRIPSQIFKKIEQYAPFTSVDIIIEKDEKIILTKRAIMPYRGYWHLPGSIVLKNELVLQAVERSVWEELEIKISDPRFLGIYELFTKKRHYITQAFVAHYESGQIKGNWQSTKVQLFHPDDVPARTIPIHKKMIQDAMKIRLLK